MKPFLSVSAALAAAAVAAFAAAPALAVDGPGLPSVQQQGAVAFMTGGMRETQAQAMEEEAGRYPLTLQFVRKYSSAEQAAADVKVTIKDAADKTVLDTANAGPLLLAKLPAGKYTIRAERGSVVKNQSVTLDGKKADRIVFAWKQ
jgi:hypothetical protein